MVCAELQKMYYEGESLTIAEKLFAQIPLTKEENEEAWFRKFGDTSRWVDANGNPLPSIPDEAPEEEDAEDEDDTDSPDGESLQNTFNSGG